MNFQKTLTPCNGADSGNIPNARIYGIGHLKQGRFYSFPKSKYNERFKENRL